MKQIMIGMFLFFFLVAEVAAQRTILFDNDWKFFKGNDTAARLFIFNDTKWRDVDLPHDYSIEDLHHTNSPFDSNAVGQVNVGFTVGGTAWYRKTFKIPATKKGQRTSIQFDGVYMNANFWINGVFLGNHPYGYTSFIYDVTEHLNWNGNNVISVQVQNEGKNSRWYSGSGIYRHVWLTSTQPVHVAQWGTFVTTPKVSASSASVRVQSTLQNESNQTASIKLITKIRDSKGVEKGMRSTTQSLAPGSSIRLQHELIIKSPQLWSIETPVLHSVITEVYQNNKLVDQLVTPFGVRSIKFSVDKGFQLNGKTLKLKGGCVHHDNGSLGAKAYDRAEERKVQLLKASGYNAIRTSHNPPSPAFLEACDRLGMLVIDEAFDTWNERKNRNDYNLYFNDWWQKDLESMLLRDRNHPSIIMWSTGNEIPNRGTDAVGAVAQELTNFIKTYDTTRPVTAGVNGIDQSPNTFLNALDIAGYNYAEANYEIDHEKYPKRIMYGSESYPLEAYRYWMDVEDHNWVIGDFVWTAFDYIGEASIGWLGYPQSKKFFPWNLAYCGDIDVCGWKRPQSFYRDALWKKDQVSIFVKPPKPTFAEFNAKPEVWSRWNWQDVASDWTWPGYTDSLLEVSVYSSCDSVTLYSNGKSLGSKATNRDTRFMATYIVPYNAGVLKAVGHRNGKVLAIFNLQTGKVPTKIRLTADRSAIKANNQDLSYITVELVDDKGTRNTKTEGLVKFTLEGPGEIVGVGNANPKSIESFQATERTTWQGRCQVIVKSTSYQGNITLYASVAGMPKAKVLIRTSK